MSTAPSMRGRASASSPVEYHSTGQINRDAYPTRGSRRCLTLRVTSFSNLINPTTNLPLLSKTVSLKKSGHNEEDRFRHEETLSFPYNGESVLRLMLSDGVYQLDWAEVPIDNDSFELEHEATIPLTSRHSSNVSAGTISLCMKKCGSRVQTTVDTDRTPLGAAKEHSHQSPPRLPSINHAVDEVPTAPNTPVVSDIHSLRATVTSIGELDKSVKNVYVILEQGETSLRGPTVDGISDGWLAYDQTFIMPVTELGPVKVKIYENKKLAIDPLVGESLLPSVASIPNTSVPILNKDGNRTCVLHLDVIASHRPEPVARVESTPSTVPRPNRARSEESDFDRDDLSSVENEKLRGNTMVLVNSLSVRIAKSFDSSDEAFVKARLGKHDLRCETFGVSGDELVFPYNSEKYMYFVSQQDRKLARDPITGQGKLDLTDFVKREHSNTAVSVPMIDPESGKRVGDIDVLVSSTSHRTVKKPVVNHAVKATKKVSMTDDSAGSEPKQVVNSLYQSLDIELVKMQDIPVKESPIDPYVYLILGDQKLKGQTVKNCITGSSVVGDLFKLRYQPVEFIKFEIYDDQKMRRDPLLSSAKLSLNNIVTSDRYNEVQRLKIPLFKADGSSGGSLFMKVKCHTDNLYSSASVEKMESTPQPKDKSLSSDSSSVVSSEVEMKADKRHKKPLCVCTLPEHERPLCYEVKVKNCALPFGEHPYLEVCVGDGKKVRLEQAFKVVPEHQEAALLIADHSDCLMKLVLKDNKKMKIDPVLVEGSLDLSTLRSGESHEYAVQCNGPAGVHTLDITVSGRPETIEKATVTTQALLFSSPMTDHASALFSQYHAFHLEVTTLTDLKKTDTFSKNDPYVKLTYEQHEAVSDVFKNAGTTAEINTCFSIPLCKERMVTLGVYDKETLTKDKCLGTALLDLEQLYRDGGVNQNLKISVCDVKNQPTGKPPLFFLTCNISGTVHCSLKFDDDRTITRARIVKVKYA